MRRMVMNCYHFEFNAAFLLFLLPFFERAVLLTRRNVLMWQARRYHPDLMPKGSLILKGFTFILRCLLCIYRKAASNTFLATRRISG